MRPRAHPIVLASIAVAASVPLCQPAAQAQDGLQLAQQEESSDGLNLLRAADGALREMTAFSCTITREGVGAQATREPNTIARLVVSRSSGATRAGLLDDGAQPQWHVAAFGMISSPDGEELRVPFAFSMNARNARTISLEEHALMESSPEFAQNLIDDSGAWTALQWLTEWDALVGKPIVDDTPRVQPRLDGRVLIGDEAADAVYVDLAEFPGTYAFGAWWYLGVEDHLPRRFELVFYDVRGEDNTSVGDGISRLTITDIQPLASQADTAAAVVRAARVLDETNWGQPGQPPLSELVDAAEPFTLPAPDGFEVAAFQPPADERQARMPVEPPLNIPAPDFKLLDPEGNEHTLSDYKGKIVILDFWATWCGPCLMVMPELQAIHERFKGQGVVVMGINAWENADPKALMDQKGFTYQLLLKGDQTAADYGVSGIPTMVVINQEGTIVQRHVGADPDIQAKLTETITNLQDRN